MPNNLIFIIMLSFVQDMKKCFSFIAREEEKIIIIIVNNNN